MYVLKKFEDGYKLFFLQQHKHIFFSDIEVKRKGIINLLRESERKFGLKFNINDIIKNKRREGPETLDIAITGRCNKKCKHCYWGELNEYNDIPLKKLKEIFKESKKLGIFNIVLTGGEPLFHKKIDKILSFLHEERFRVIIVTNGQLIKYHKETISKFKPYEVVVSLDGLKEDYERIRGKGWEDVVGGIKFLKKEQVYVRVNCILSNSIYDKIKNFEKFCRELLVDEVVFLPVAIRGSAKKYASLFLEKNKAKDIMKRIGMDEDINCKPFYRRIAVGFDGFVYPCQFFREIDFYRLGNIYENSLSYIYNLIKNSKSFPSYNEVECSKCSFFKKCRGGCRGRALALLNNLSKKDPVWCKIIAGKRISEDLLPEPRDPLYTVLAKDYINYTPPSAFYKKAYELIKILKPKSVLEIGCGNGQFIKRINFVKNRVGIDYSSDMIKLAKEKNNNVVFINNNILNYNLKQKFDISIALFSFFNHFKNEEDIKKIFHKLRKISIYFLFDSIDIKKFKNKSQNQHYFGNVRLKTFVYKDKKYVYDFREYKKKKEKYFYSYSFPIIHWKNFFKENKTKLIKKIPVSNIRNLYLVKFCD